MGASILVWVFGREEGDVSTDRAVQWGLVFGGHARVAGC
jgi:hypothetical protein